MTDDEIHLLLLTLSPDDVLDAYVPYSVAVIAKAAFYEDHLEKAIWACAGLLSSKGMRATPAQYDARRHDLMMSWALKGLHENAAYWYMQTVLARDLAWPANDAVHACNRAGYSGVASTFKLLATAKSDSDRAQFVGAAALFYRTEKRHEAATILLRDLCRLFYD